MFKKRTRLQPQTRDRTERDSPQIESDEEELNEEEKKLPCVSFKRS
jgi:hypothetical protein